MIALVVPSHQQAAMHGFLRAWRGLEWWDVLIVVEDGPARTFTDLPPDTIHVSHAEIADIWGASSWIISRKDSACRSLGLYLAWREGADTIFTLDTDCFPHPGHEDFARRHLAALYATPRWSSSVPGLRVRGLPYGDPGVLPVVLNVGLWSHVPDLDGACQLALGVPADFTPPNGRRVLAHGEYAPICGMNLAFRREFAPIAYFGLQGPPYPYARMDDIWFGVIAKRICDHLGWSISVGEPFIRHERASDPFVNLVKEAPGIQVHESLWRFVDRIELTETTAAGCMLEVADVLPGFSLDPYWERLGRAMRLWVRMFVEPRGAGLRATSTPRTRSPQWVGSPAGQSPASAT